MRAYEKNWVRLPLGGAANVRELGGYPATGGKQTAYHRFVRADRLCDLSDADVEFLRGYGVVLVVDLRGAGEAASDPDRNLGPDVDHIHQCLIDFDATDAADVHRLIVEGEIRLEKAYRQMLDGKSAVAAVFHAIATARPGCVLFHCTAGKDRTGVVAALLLMLAGVDRQDVCSNYAQTRENLMRLPWYRKEYCEAGEVERKMMDSDPAVMGEVYDYLVDAYGTVEDYLMSCGVSADDLAVLKKRLVG